MPEQLELLKKGALVHNQFRLLCFQAAFAAEGVGELGAEGLETREGVHDGQLTRRLQQGLMIVGPVNVDQPLSDIRQHAQRGRGAIHELPVCSGGGEGPFQEELTVPARLEPVLFEISRQRGAQGRDVEDRFDRAGVAPGTDHGPVSALAENEIESADQDGFAGTRFTCDRVVARTQFEGEICDQRQILNPQGCQHAQYCAKQCRVRPGSAKRKLQVLTIEMAGCIKQEPDGF